MGLLWKIRPNYLNQKPSEISDDRFSISGNYFYLDTLYYIDSNDAGLLSCSIDVPHVPAMVREITTENIDTTVYSSQFIITKS